MAGKEYFDAVRRDVFGGRLTAGQVNGMNRITDYAKLHGYSREFTAYALATAYHETAGWMHPIREGARRYGPDYTDLQAQRAVAAIYNKGIIRRNYALPDGPWKQCYYGRGLVQITWYDNYRELGGVIDLPLAQYPDLALTWDAALPLLFVGMAGGLYTGRELPDNFDITDTAALTAYRAVINGDTKTNGKTIARLAQHFHAALGSEFVRAVCPTCGR